MFSGLVYPNKNLFRITSIPFINVSAIVNRKKHISLKLKTNTQILKTRIYSLFFCRSTTKELNLISVELNRHHFPGKCVISSDTSSVDKLQSKEVSSTSTVLQ